MHRVRFRYCRRTVVRCTYRKCPAHLGLVFSDIVGELKDADKIGNVRADLGTFVSDSVGEPQDADKIGNLEHRCAAFVSDSVGEPQDAGKIGNVQADLGPVVSGDTILANP